MTPLVMDLVLAVVLVLCALSGYRHGFVVTVMALVGFLSGGAVGMWLLPELLRRWVSVDSNIVLHNVVLLCGVFLFATLGQAIAVHAGSRLRRGLRVKPARAVDSAMGALASVLADCPVVTIEGARHFGPNTHPDAVAAVLIELVSRAANPR